MSTPPTDLFKRLARQGVRLNAEPEGWERGVLLRFWRVESDALILKLESKVDDPDALVAGMRFWGVFENIGRVRTFTSQILEVVRRPDGAIAGLRCSIPDEVRSEDRRRAFRVPRIFPFAVRGTLVSGDQSWPCTIKNLSVLGVLLDFPAEVADALADEVPYHLQIDTFEGSAKIGARVVRRTRNGGIAMRFPSATNMGEVAPPPDLARVVRTAELIWLRKRQGTEKKGSGEAA